MLSNKRRLYIAYYNRPNATSSSDYHSGLMSLSKDKTDATVFHATISPGLPWQFEAKRMAPRTPRLVGLLYIGKLDHNATEEMLANLLRDKVPINGANPNWSCLNWVYDAIKVLVAAGIIEQLQCSPEELWMVGADYADHWRITQNDGEELIEPGAPVPCCDVYGNHLPGFVL